MTYNEFESDTWENSKVFNRNKSLNVYNDSPFCSSIPDGYPIWYVISVCYILVIHILIYNSVGASVTGQYFEGEIDLSLYSNPVLSFDYTTFNESLGLGRVTFSFDCGNGLHMTSNIIPTESNYKCPGYNINENLIKYDYHVQSLPPGCQSNSNVIIRFDFTCMEGESCLTFAFSNILIVDTINDDSINGCITDNYLYSTQNESKTVECSYYMDNYNISNDLSNKLYSTQEFRNDLTGLGEFIYGNYTSSSMTIICNHEYGCELQSNIILGWFQYDLICNAKS